MLLPWVLPVLVRGALQLVAISAVESISDRTEADPMVPCMTGLGNSQGASRSAAATGPNW